MNAIEIIEKGTTGLVGSGVWLGSGFLFMVLAVWSVAVWRCQSVRVLAWMAALASAVSLAAALWAAASLARTMLLIQPATSHTTPTQSQQSPPRLQSTR